MGLVYLPTWMVDFYGTCRWIYQSHGYYGNGLVQPTNWRNWLDLTFWIVSWGPSVLLGNLWVWYFQKLPKNWTVFSRRIFFAEILWLLMGWNPKQPPGMYKTLKIMGYTTNLNWCRISSINRMSMLGTWSNLVIQVIAPEVKGVWLVYFWGPNDIFSAGGPGCRISLLSTTKCIEGYGLSFGQGMKQTWICLKCST